MTLAVHSAVSASHNGFDLPAGKLLDGEGEYIAAFDPAARRAVIRLTGLDATLALANFIRRIFTRLVINHNGAVFHSACVVRKNAAYLFFGKSGSGKSTVCELSRGDTIASDDLTAIRSLKGRLRAWGLPSLRAPPYQLSQGVFPIRAAFTLVQDSKNFIKRLEVTAAMAGMLALPADLSEPLPTPAEAGFPLRQGFGGQVATFLRPPESRLSGRSGQRREAGEQVGKIVDLLTRLVQTVPCYELHFRKDREFWNEIDAELKVDRL